MTQEEAEEAVAGNAQTSMIISAVVLALTVAYVGWVLYKKRMQKQRAQEFVREVEAEPNTEGRNEDGQVSNQTFAYAEGGVVKFSNQAGTEEGNACSNQAGVEEGNAGSNQAGIEGGNAGAAVVGKPEDDDAPISRSRSRLEVMDEKLKASPSKAMMIRGMFPVILLVLLSWSVIQAFTDERPWHETLGNFLPVVAAALLVVAVVARFSIFFGKHGLQKTMEVMTFSNGNSMGPMVFVFRAVSNTLLLFPFVSAAALAWSFNRMTNPGGVYWSCS